MWKHRRRRRKSTRPSPSRPVVPPSTNVGRGSEEGREPGVPSHYFTLGPHMSPIEFSLVTSHTPQADSHLHRLGFPLPFPSKAQSVFFSAPCLVFFLCYP